jgi:hypothetical protein
MINEVLLTEKKNSQQRIILDLANLMDVREVECVKIGLSVINLTKNSFLFNRKSLKSIIFYIR